MICLQDQLSRCPGATGLTQAQQAERVAKNRDAQRMDNDVSSPR